MFSIRCQKIARSLFNIQSTVILQSALTGNGSKQRVISTSRVLEESHYDSLGIPASSTQNDIKAAYYKLSMIYHPDRNQGCESAANKFREITQAYEVLSNYRLRRLYDKGIIHTAGPQYARPQNMGSDLDDAEEDDPQTKFYKSRFSKSKVTKTQGQTPIYDFDEWAKAHYGKSFDRRKSAKERYDHKVVRDKDRDISMQNEMIIFGVLIGFAIFYLIIYSEQSYDTPKAKNKGHPD